jgi:glutathione peroxidase
MDKTANWKCGLYTVLLCRRTPTMNAENYSSWQWRTGTAWALNSALVSPTLIRKFFVMKFSTILGFASTAAAVVFSSLSAAAPAPAAKGATASCPALLNQKFEALQGGSRDMCDYAGKVVLVVNTASYCGYTKQYEGLQAIYDKYRERGLVVVGFPANDFGKQEPGSNAEVADFCERTYKVKFPMMTKTSVVEGTANPLHEALAKSTGQRPKWNFHKYLIGRDGTTVASFASKVDPESAEMKAEIERLLVASSVK